MEETLVGLERLLRRTREYGWADVISKQLARLETDRREVLEWLARTALWGGSGTLWDIILSPDNHHFSDDFCRDKQHFRDLLLKLIQDLRNEGYERDYFRTCEAFLRHR